LENEVQGKPDNQKYETCKNSEVDELIKVHKSEGLTIGVSGTPLFVIDGKVVNVADIPGIENILKETGLMPGKAAVSRLFIFPCCLF